MTEERSKAGEKITTEKMDYSGRPFGFIEPDAETAMVCEQDPVIRDKVTSELKKMGFAVVQPAGFKEALKYMRFHIFHVIFIDEDFDTGVWETNNVLRYLENLNMSIRRQSFAVLVSAKIATMDNLEAFNKSVNLVINKRDIGGVEKVLRQSMAEHEEFYRVFKEKNRN
jgi:CheY-like chemotaxis protein